MCVLLLAREAAGERVFFFSPCAEQTHQHGKLVICVLLPFSDKHKQPHPNSYSSGQCLHSKPLSAYTPLAPCRLNPPWGRHLHLWCNCHWSWYWRAPWSLPAFSVSHAEAVVVVVVCSCQQQQLCSTAPLHLELQTPRVWWLILRITVDSLTAAFPPSAARKPFSSATTSQWRAECLRSLPWFPSRARWLTRCSADPGFI